MHDEAIIECQRLVPEELPFEYHGDALDFGIDRGEVTSIIGPDYSGKGNWLRTICGLEDPLSGSVQYQRHRHHEPKRTGLDDDTQESGLPA